MIFKSATTQFSSMVYKSTEAYMRWRFMSNWVSAANKFSLPNCVVYKESVFTIELCCLQRIHFHCRIVVSAANQFSLPNRVVCSESVFAAEFWCLQRIGFRCRILGRQWISFRCWFSTIDSHCRNDLNTCNDFIVWLCKIWNTWMWTYGFFK
jgi:hypothetical protein